MNIRFSLLVFLCCLLLCAPVQARKHAPAKKAAPEQGDHETVDVPGTVIKEPNAFHGVKWGTPMAMVPDLTVLEKDGQATYAQVPGVVYRIGGATLRSVVYGFCEGKFAAVMVEYSGKKAHDAIRGFLSGKYAAPVELAQPANDLAWPLGNVLIRMRYQPDSKAGSLTYFYQPLFAPCAGPQGTAPK